MQHILFYSLSTNNECVKKSLYGGILGLQFAVVPFYILLIEIFIIIFFFVLYSIIHIPFPVNGIVPDG